jgi:hypothetical protein
MTPKTRAIEAVKQSQRDRRVELAEWRAKQLREVTLPSGLKVTLRSVTITDLALTGKLPESILAMANKADEGGKEAVDLMEISRNAGEFTAMLDLLIRLSLVEPALGDEPDEDHIALAEISSDDKMAIFNTINGGAAELQPFREGEGEPAAAAHAGRSVRRAPELDPGTAERLDRVSTR